MGLPKANCGGLFWMGCSGPPHIRPPPVLFLELALPACCGVHLNPHLAWGPASARAWPDPEGEVLGGEDPGGPADLGLRPEDLPGVGCSLEDLVTSTEDGGRREPGRAVHPEVAGQHWHMTCHRLRRSPHSPAGHAPSCFQAR